jgi:hypothetical protein
MWEEVNKPAEWQGASGGYSLGIVALSRMRASLRSGRATHVSVHYFDVNTSGIYLSKMSEQRFCKTLAPLPTRTDVHPVVRHRCYKKPYEQSLGWAGIQTVEHPIEKMVVVKKMLLVKVRRQLQCVSDTRLPVALSNRGNDTIQELFNRACPASSPSHRASLSLALVCTQFVDAYTFRQPQSPRKGYILVETLFQQHLAREAVGDRAAEPSEAGCGIRQIVEPSFSGGIAQRQPRRRFEVVWVLKTSVLLPLLQHGNEERRQRGDARLVLEIRPQRRASGVRLVHNLRLVAYPALDQRLGERILGIGARPREQVRSLAPREVHQRRDDLRDTELGRVLHARPARQYALLLRDVSRVHGAGPRRYGEVRGRLIREGVYGQFEAASDGSGAVEDLWPAPRGRSSLARAIMCWGALVL